MVGVVFVMQMDPDNKPTREELKDEVLKVSKGLVGLGGFNLVSSRQKRRFRCWPCAQEKEMHCSVGYSRAPTASLRGHQLFFAHLLISASWIHPSVV